MAEESKQFADGTKLVMALVLSWSTASHLAWSGPQEGAFAEAGLPSRVVSGEELQDLMPLEPLWDIILPLMGLAVGTSLGAFGMQLTLGLTFVQPLLLLLLPSFLSVLEHFHERLLAWHLGGIFGQPMLVAQVAIARAQRHQQSGVLKAFGVLVGIYAIGAVLGGLIRSLLQMWPFGRQALAKILIFNLVAGNLFAIWHQGHLLGEHHEPQEREPLTPKGKLLRRRIFLFLLAELQRTMHSFCSCCRHLAARAAILLSLTCIMGPAPLPALDLLSLKWPRSHFAVFWFDLVGVLSYAIIVPQLNLFRHIGWSLDVFFVSSSSCCVAAVAAAMLHSTAALTVAMIAGLCLSSCCAVISAVLTADMSEKAPHLADVGVRLAWGLLCGAMAQYVGAHLGQVLFLWSSWSGVCGFALSCLVASRYWTQQALENTTDIPASFGVNAAPPFRPAPG